MASRRHTLVITFAACLLAVAAGAPAALAATGYEMPEPAVVSVDGDRFYNHDFSSPNYLPPSDVTTARPDWPVTVVFTGGATIPKVRRIVASLLPSIGSPVYARFKDSPYRWQWDVDLGRKQTALTLEDGRLVPRALCLHIRLYARCDLSNRNATWGRYVLCTTHFDFNEFGQVPGVGFSWSGLSETAEEMLAGWFAGKGYAVDQDAFDCGNAFFDPLPPPLDPTGTLGDGHVWQSDGMATLIRIP
jgi:hypothetical protein